MAYYGIITFQSFIMMVGILFTFFMLKQRGGQLSKLMLSVAFLTTIMNAGNLLELLANSVDGAFTAIRLKYLGGVYLASAFLVFCGRYCRKEVSKKILYFLLFWDTVMLIMLWTTDLHHLFFKDMYYLEKAAIPHMERPKAIFYHLYVCGNMLQMISGIGICLVSALRSKNRSIRVNGLKSIWCIVPPLIAYIATFSGAFEGVDLLPGSLGVGCIIMLISICFQKSLRLSDVIHERILKNLSEPIIAVDNHYNLVEVNEAALQIFPWLSDIDKASNRFKTTSKEYLMTGEREVTIGERTYALHPDVIMDGKEQLGYCLRMIDLTSQKEQLRNMRRLKEEADRANQVKSEFLASMSHEIRTPLNAIIGMNRIIMRETKEDLTKEYAADVQSSSEILLTLINDILDSSKIASGKLEIHPVEYEIQGLFDDLYNMMVDRAKEKQLEFHMDMDKQLPVRLFGDDVRVRQVIINLLTNAVKYTKQGRVDMTVKGIRDGEKLLLQVAVKDTGIGIKPENIDKVLGKFERIEEESTHYVEGTGLGLSITIQLLQLMGSELKVESEYGKGSSFSFELAQKIIDDTPISDCAKKESASTKEKAKFEFVAPDARVLVVDDNKMNLKLFQLLLRPVNMHITAVFSGKEALEQVAKKKYDLIFLDHLMPEMDGIETLHEMQKFPDSLNKETPVIMLTANAVSGAKEEYLKEGFASFLSKPVDTTELSNILVKFIPDKLRKA